MYTHLITNFWKKLEHDVVHGAKKISGEEKK